MTSKSVSDISAYFVGTAGKQMAGSAKASVEAGSFSNVMNQASGKNTGETDHLNQSSQTRVDHSSKAEKTITKNQNANQKNDQKVSADQNKVDEKVKEATTKVMDELKKQFGVTDEDIINAMQTLGLQMTDLLNTEAVTNIVVEITGIQDTADLLTDGNLYQGLKDVLSEMNKITDGLLDELGISKEELGEVLAAQTMNQNPVPEQMPADYNGEIVNADMKSEQTEEKEPVIIVKNETGKSQQTEDLNNTETPKVAPETEKVKGAKNDSKEAAAENQSFAGSQSTDRGTFTELVKEPQGVSYSGAVDTEQIMKQIVDQIKITMRPDTTSMELELNPASLGKVGVQVEAKNGVITAQFTAQNESVKAAIESQIVQLKEDLNNQGVKVEAVEVAIASHEFERNLQQGNEGQREKEERTSSVGGRKRNNISLLNDEEEELTEEEELAKKILIQNGGTVDYTA